MKFTAAGVEVTAADDLSGMVNLHVSAFFVYPPTDGTDDTLVRIDGLVMKKLILGYIMNINEKMQVDPDLDEAEVDRALDIIKRRARF